MVFDSEKGGKDHGSSPVHSASFTKAAMADLTLSMSSPVEHYTESPERTISFISAVSVAADCIQPFGARRDFLLNTSRSRTTS